MSRPVGFRDPSNDRRSDVRTALGPRLSRSSRRRGSSLVEFEKHILRRLAPTLTEMDVMRAPRKHTLMTNFAEFVELLWIVEGPATRTKEAGGCLRQASAVLSLRMSRSGMPPLLLSLLLSQSAVWTEELILMGRGTRTSSGCTGATQRLKNCSKVLPSV